MKISARQMDDMQANRSREGDRHLHPYARQRLPETTSSMDEAALQTQIDAMRRIADPLEVSERDAAFLLDLVLLYGPNFDREDWADILSEDGIDGATRVDILRGRTRDAIGGA